MTSDSIRHSFIETFGDEKYEEFVLSLYEAFPLREKLLFWQDKLLDGFFKDLNIQRPILEEVYSIFGHCPMHDTALKKDNVPIINGNAYTDHLTLREERKLFPFANVHAPRDLDRFEYPERIDVLYCSKCREERSIRIRLIG